MFRNRENELKAIRALINKQSERCKAFLVYGKRRIGKSLLIKEAMKGYDGIFINFIATDESYDRIVRDLARAVADADDRLGYFSSMTDLHDILTGLNASGLRIVLAIDEYPYMKGAYEHGDLDSIFLREMESLGGSVTIGFCGSFIRIMEGMIEPGSPLYGRFDLALHLKAFNYLEAAAFYQELPAYDRLAFYSVFGGMPFALDRIDPKSDLKENIIRLLLNPKEYVFLVLNKTLLEEIRKVSTAEAILTALGNGKARNSELASGLNMSSSLVAMTTKKLIEMDIIEKVSPINRDDERKKAFYEISDNIVRFFYAFVFPNIGRIETYGAEHVYRRFIEPSLGSFIAKRFEGTAREYFIERIRMGGDDETSEVGTYWYDLPKERRNGEFDCVLKRNNGYSIAECKFLKDPMQLALAKKEEEKILAIDELDVNGVIFVSASGFSFTSDQWELITGDDMYSIRPSSHQ